MASKGSIVGIVAWVLVAVLAIGAGALGFLAKAKSGQAADWRDALQQAAVTAGVAELPADAAAADVLQQVQQSVQSVQQELVAAKDALTAAQTEATGAKAEAADLAQKVDEQTAAAEKATQEAAAKDEALAAAKAEAEQAAADVQAAQTAAEKQQAKLEKTIAGLKTKLAEETARLEAELEAARQTTAPTEEAVEAEPAAEEMSPEEIAALAAQDEERRTRTIGQSTMIGLIRYAADEQSLFLRLLDGQELTYLDVPPSVYDQLISAPDKLDMNYRFKIQGEFKSVPPDSVVVRKFFKWQRRKGQSGDVRVVDPPPPPAEEPAAEPEEEAAPADVDTSVAAPAAEEAPAAAEAPAAEEIQDESPVAPVEN